MKLRWLVLTGLAAIVGAANSGAAAQVLDLTGDYQCVQACAMGPPALAHVAQNGWELNLVNEAGDPSRAWIDYPGHLWAERWNEGAIISRDGTTIQFDRGTVWQRVVAVPAPPPPPPPRKVRVKRHKVPAPLPPQGH
jgi:DNA-binding helix-hairpin-helix protein with protein kinase domain